MGDYRGRMSPHERKPAVYISSKAMAFKETLRFRVEPGITRAVVEAARRERVTTSDYIRRALRARLVGDGVGLPPVTHADEVACKAERPAATSARATRSAA